MSYSNMTVREIWENARWSNDERAGWTKRQTESRVFRDAYAWVEAENIMLVREIVCRYFDALQADTLEDFAANPFDTTVTQDMADKLVEELDADFQIESGRFPDGGVGPEMHRLPPEKRLAMAQEVFASIMTSQQIMAEVKRRKKAKIPTPPLASVGGGSGGFYGTSNSTTAVDISTLGYTWWPPGQRLTILGREGQ